MSSLRHHVASLDRALVRLLDERARLAREIGSRGAEPFVDDLLRRADGDFPADVLVEVFALVQRGCGVDPIEVQP